MTKVLAIMLSIGLAGTTLLWVSQPSAQQPGGSGNSPALYTCKPGKNTYVCSHLEKAASQGVCDTTTKVCSCSTTGAAYDQQVQC